MSVYEKLYTFQKEIIDSLCPLRTNALFSDTGTGKSLMILSMFEEHIKLHNIKRMIIICLNAKVDEWFNDCFKFFPNKKIIKAEHKYEKEILLKDFDILIINFEKTWRMPNALLCATDDTTFIAIDESHKVKEPSSKQTKFIMALGEKANCKTIATATPMEQGYHNLYAQFRFLGILGGSYIAFKERYCMEQSQYNGISYFKKIVGYRNIEELDIIIKKYCRYYTREIEQGLEPGIFEISIPLEKDYFKIAKDRIYKDIVLTHISQKRHFLKALCSGVATGKDLEMNTHTYYLNTYKIDWILNFLKEFKQRVVIFYEYNIQRDMLYKSIAATGRNIARYCGEFKEKDIFDNNDDCVILVQPKSGSTGVDWLKMSHVSIYYDVPTSYIEFYQSMGRTNRFGQYKKPLYFFLLGNNKYAVDRMCYESVKNKEDFTDQIFDKNFKEMIK